MDTTLTPRIRRPAVSGYFYPEDPQVLRQVVGHLLERVSEPSRVQGVVVPHGSLRQSGAVAGAVFGRIAIPRRCVIVAPSHAGSAMRWSLFARGGYRTPLGVVEIDEPFCATLLESCPFLEADPWGHRGEHAIEVILPFLQLASPSSIDPQARAGPGALSIVPLVTSSDQPEEVAGVAQALEHAIRAQEEDVLLIASSDLSHYEAVESGREKDQRLIELILSKDGPALMREVQGGLAAMCGSGAVACVLMAATRLGATRTELIRYGTSLEAAGDPNSVTGYAGVTIA